MSKYKLLIISFILGFVLIFLQQTVFSNFLSLQVVPNLILIFCIYLTIMVPQSVVNILVFILGLFVDSNIGLLLGPSSMSLLIVYIILSQLSQRIVLHSFFSVLIITFCANIVFSIFYLLILSQLISGFEYSLIKILLEAILTGVLAPFFFYVFSLVIGKQKSSD